MEREGKGAVIGAAAVSRGGGGEPRRRCPPPLQTSPGDEFDTIGIHEWGIPDADHVGRRCFILPSARDVHKIAHTWGGSAPAAYPSAGK